MIRQAWRSFETLWDWLVSGPGWWLAAVLWYLLFMATFVND